MLGEEETDESDEQSGDEMNEIVGSEESQDYKEENQESSTVENENEGMIFDMDTPDVNRHEIGLEVPKSKPILLKARMLGSKKNIEGLIDSGASSCVVNEELIKLLELEERIVKVRPMRINVALEKKGTETDEAVQIPLEVNFGHVKVNMNIVAYVVRNVRKPLYFGLPFIEKYSHLIKWQRPESVDATEMADTRDNKSIAEEPSITLEDPQRDQKETEAQKEAVLKQVANQSVKDTHDITKEETVEELGVNEVELIDSNEFLRSMRSNQSHIGLLSIQAMEGDNPPSTPNYTRATQEILYEFKDVVNEEEPDKLPPKREWTHRITLLEGTQPTYRAQYRLTLQEKEELEKQVNELLKKGFIRESTSPFNAPVLFVKKKTGELRLCIDYRLLNLHTVKDKFPMPLIDDILTTLGNAKIFSKLDLKSGYHQLRINPQDIEKTAFSSPTNHYEWVVMPFGLTNAPSTFQRAMNTTLKDFIGKFVQVYLDDILIYSTTAEEHAEHLKMVLQTLRAHKFVAKLSKCSFFQEKLPFLGFIVGKEGIEVDQSKINTIKEWKTPTSIVQAQSFLGLANFYRRFVKDFSKIAAPINEYIGKKCKWGEDQDKAFEDLKQCLISAPVLVNPIFKEGFTYQVTTDACGHALGYVLELLDPHGDKLGVVAYGSKKLIGAQLNYPTREKEFLAIIEALKQWRSFLMYRQFVIRTDHHSLIYLNHVTQPNQGRLARWLDFMSQFDFVINYLPGKKNSAADALSRKDDESDAEVVQSMEFEDGYMFLNELENGSTSQAIINNELKDDILEGIKEHSEFKEIYDILTTEDSVIPTKIKHYIKHFKMNEDGFLCYQAIIGDPEFRIIVPDHKNLRKRLVSYVHDNGGHYGALRTYEVIARQFYWPRMFNQVRKFVYSCFSCQKNKPSTRLLPGLLKPLEVPQRPHEWVTIDFLTGIPTSAKKNDMIFVIVDRYTKRIKLIPCQKSLTAKGAAELFIKYYMVEHGLPKSITSDKDIRFMAYFWRTLWATLGTNLLFSTTSHPQTDGQSERTMRTLNQNLRALAIQHIRHWDTMLPLIEFSYNSSHNSVINNVPFMVDKGFVPDGPVYTSLWSVRDLDRLDPRAENYAKMLQAVVLDTKDQIAESQGNMENQYNKHKRDDHFALGDQVLIHKNVWGTNSTYNKMRPIYFGPYRIIKVLNENSYEVDLPVTNNKQKSINIQYLKKFVERDDRYMLQVPRTPLEMRQRINEIAAINGFDHRRKLLTVNWQYCNPIHHTTITYEDFDLMTDKELKTQLIQAAEILKPQDETSDKRSRLQNLLPQ